MTVSRSPTYSSEALTTELPLDKPGQAVATAFVRRSLQSSLNRSAPRDSISVSDISKHLGIDRSYFSTVFRQSQGMPPAEYLLQLRMRKSGHMLEMLTMSIQEIAGLVGYEDALTFSKAFKRFYGVSPMRYREMTPDERERLRPNIEKRGVGPRRE